MLRQCYWQIVGTRDRATLATEIPPRISAPNFPGRCLASAMMPLTAWAARSHRIDAIRTAWSDGTDRVYGNARSDRHCDRGKRRGEDPGGKSGSGLSATNRFHVQDAVWPLRGDYDKTPKRYGCSADFACIGIR